MMRTKLFKRAFLLLCVIGLLNLLGDTFYLFDFVWGYDIVLHLLSGVLMGICVFIFFGLFPLLKKQSRNTKLFVAVLSAFIAGIIWEYYELHFGLTFLSDGAVYFSDTAKDIMLDTFGGFVGAFYSSKVLSNQKNA
jgi:hypothetical protein